jgi:ABC-type hemin transport system substrate-binding protein
MQQKMIAIIAAASLVTVGTIGIILLLDQEEGDPGWVAMSDPGTFVMSKDGVLICESNLNEGEYNIRWETFTSEDGGTALDVFNSMNIGEASGWNFWSAKDGYVAFTKTEAAPILYKDATGARILPMIGDHDRIGTMSASITEMVAELAEERIVGTDSWSDWPGSVKEKREGKRIGDFGSYWGGINFEAIIAANTDIMIMDGDALGQDSVIKSLRDVGRTVLAVSGHKGSLEETYMNLLMIGLVTKTSDGANDIVRNIINQSAILAATVESSGKSGTKILFMMPPDASKAHVAGNGGTIGSLLTTLGLQNALTRAESWSEINLEHIFGSEPYIVVVMGLYGGPFTHETLEGHSMLGSMDAVKEGRICILSGRADDIMSRQGPAVADAMAILVYLATLNWSEPIEIGDDYLEIIGS